MRTETKFIVFHTSATPADWNIGAAEILHLHTAPKTEEIPWGIYDLHGKAWSDIGYHLILPRNGVIELGRDLDAIGAHVKGYNRISIGICMVGGISEDGQPEDNYTDEQWRAADFLVPLLAARYHVAEIVGHRDLSPDANGDGVIDRHDWLKLCPCFDARERWNNA